MPPTEFRDDHTPFGYLVTFRSYGSWLHGTAGSVDRSHRTYGTPKLPGDVARWRYNRRRLKHRAVTFSGEARNVIADSIRETSKIRKWCLWAVNVRTNHVHAVVTANCNPDRVLNAFKANATRELRKAHTWSSEGSPWSRGGSKRYLWTEEQLVNAIAYVEYDQGLPLD